MFYLEYLLKKYGQAIKKETKPRDSVVSVKFKPGMKPEPKPLQETIDVETGKPFRSTYALGGPKVKTPLDVKVMKKVKEKVWDIPSGFWKKKLSDDELDEVNSMIEKLSQGMSGSGKTPKVKPPKDTPKKPKLSPPFKKPLEFRVTKKPYIIIRPPKESENMYLDKAIEKIAKKRYTAAAKERMGVRAKGTPQKVEETYEAIREDPKSRKWIREHPYKGRKPKARTASIAWAGYKKSKKANYDVPVILEKIGAGPDLVSTAKELERLSETAGRKTLLDFWQRLGRAALSAKLYASDPVRREMMRERAVAGAAIGAPIGGLVGYAVKPTIGGTLAGAAIGGIGVGTLGALLARRKSERAKSLLRDPMAQRALVSELARSIREKRPAELV